MFYWCFTALPKALWQLGKTLEKPAKKQNNLGKTWENKKNLETTCKKTKQPWKNLGKQKKHRNTLEQPAKTLEKHGKTKNTLEKQKKQKKQKKTKNTKKTKHNISRLFGGGVPAKTLWDFFFWFFQCFFLFWSLSAICTFLYTGRSVSSCVQACRNQSFNHCSYEHTGSEDQDCVFQFWNVRPCPR